MDKENAYMGKSFSNKDHKNISNNLWYDYYKDRRFIKYDNNQGKVSILKNEYLKKLKDKDKMLIIIYFFNLGIFYVIFKIKYI